MYDSQIQQNLSAVNKRPGSNSNAFHLNSEDTGFESQQAIDMNTKHFRGLLRSLVANARVVP